ncbi:multidrug efflux pump subunit AcrB [Bacillus mesophilus]|uniref:Efflux RND transporter permease subunit n=1 Tax=Bacillus mesophilus TaxID=1808955 RepID=A0A6M0QCX7_9BACI|nr:efflux RND transporter permease subunit [Bacillus mesophilus]MBM7663495.1 multidrug efflux pump subunit AcrB [Bacillus mesophilus]NEY74156.1 efflux RND transporter permease subunit [Bacillus mesophilus]
MKWLLERSKVILVLFFVFALLGIYTFLMIPQRELPETNVNLGSIITIYPGASVSTVERLITNPVENAIQSIDGVNEFTSSSKSGVSSVIVTLDEEVNKTEVLGEIRQAVAVLSSAFPEGTQAPTVTDINNNSPLVSFHLTAESYDDLQGLSDVMERWETEIESIPGIASVTIKGLAEKQLVLSLSSKEMAAKGIGFQEVLGAINKEYYPTPLGTQRMENQNYQLKLGQTLKLSEMESIVVGKDLNGEQVFLSDIGSVESQFKSPVDIVSYKGKPSLSFTAYIKQGESIPTVNDRVSVKVEELSKSLPEYVTLVEYYSQAKTVTSIFDGLFSSFLIAVGAVILVTLLGLTLTGSIVVAIAVPLSVLLGLIPLPFAGVDLNQISIIGLIIALGILVDDSIVMNDNIQRRYTLGDSPLMGAVNGVKEIWVSVVTSTLAIVFTFSPLIFLSGGNGAFIRALPTVLITTILASTVIALLFVPMMQYLFYKKPRSRKHSAGIVGKGFDWIGDSYAKVLRGIGKRPVLISIIGLILTTSTFALILFTPFEFFPAADKEEVTIDVAFPVGTTLAQTNEILKEMADLLESDSGVYETSIFAGTGVPRLFSSSLDETGEYTGQIVARVDRDKQTAKDLITKWTEPLREQFPNAVIFMNTIEQGPPSGAPVTVTIQGTDMEKLLQIRNQVKKEIENLQPELVTDSVGQLKPTMIYEPKREQLSQYNVSLDQISRQIRLATDGIPVGSFDDGNQTLNLVVYVDRLEPGTNLDLSKMDMAVFTGKSASPESVKMTELVSVKEGQEIPVIQHLEGVRSIVIRAFPGEAENFKSEVGKIVEALRGELDENSYTIELGGENDNQESFFVEISILFTIVIFLVYLLIAFQFNSLSMPFLVLVAVYLAIAGAILGLFVTQTPISFLAVMGMVSLTGIVVRNSVVLLEFIQQRRREGITPLEAVIESGRTRIRPILLTTLTSIVALIPIATGGDPLFTPLAVTIISGILFSTLLTLVIVPSLFLTFVRK